MIITQAELAEWRAGNAAAKAALGPGPELAVVHELALPGPGARTVRARLLVPTPSPAGVLVYLHGGGWVTGSIDTFDRLGRRFAERSGWAVLMVDYAKAPEHPFPAGLEDAWAALVWAGSQVVGVLAGLGAPLDGDLRLVAGGDSSGGNLATVCARRARDAGGPALAGQLLVYPVTDCDLDRPSHRADPQSRARLDLLWSLYCPAGLRTGPDASPLRAASLAGLPPTLLVTAEFDTLNEEIDAYATRLATEGVPVRRHRLDGLRHGSLSYWKETPEANRGVEAATAWLRSLAGPGR